MCAKGKLVVFEGIDGSGKSTQFELMCKTLERKGISFERLVFPQYSEPSSMLIRMYLNGEFGTDPEAVNAYAAASFYAVDRYASYIKKWRGYYENGGLILTDRYTTSNAVHQGSKLTAEAREGFFKWLYEYEFKLLGLPAPDTVIYMDVPVEVSLEQMRKREQQTHTHGDIHETDSEYLAKCCESGCQAAKYYGWDVISCVQGGKMREIEDIHGEIYEKLIKTITI